jgi:Chaperone of endosialidase
MKTLFQSLLLAIAAFALAGTAHAQVPPSNDTSNTTTENTGMGTGALGGPTPVLTGTENTASGWEALNADTDGTQNTASGAYALQKNTSGSQNTASGVFALQSNTTGSANTASGYEALTVNTTGNDNTATGDFALLFNNGNNNTASGGGALQNNTTGNNNTASGDQALQNNTTGSQNSASGFAALQNSTTGNGNIAVGFQAGLNLTTGSHNIDIGNKGVAAESDTIRIGATQKATFIAGIKGISVTGSAVMVSSTGQLGVTVSSERFKTAIEPMGSNTAKLEQLRPVTFHLKTDPKGALQYGLIAEEVVKVYPELVIRNESGRIDGVRYDELAPMLLNEVQQQAAEIRDLKQQQLRMQQQVAELKDLNQTTQVALRKVQPKDEFVAQR